MGIEIHAARFLQSEVRRGLRLGRMLTLGHQSIYIDGDQYRSMVEAVGAVCRDTQYADDLFRGLGATNIDVLDASNYEGANILHDLNNPINDLMSASYDCVFDGGALEHVFNFPIALKNCMEMVKVGGYFITITPTNSFCGHGFYQFSPELFYSALSAENGYAIERLLFVHRNQWYSVRKPAEIKERVELLTNEPAQIFLSARRIEQKSIFAQWPQQSDYSMAWQKGKSVADSLGAVDAFKEFILSLSPSIRRLQADWRHYKHRKKCQPKNRKWFTPVNLD